jgi:tetratricopeptide (TPR) repeat protein
MIDEDFVIEDKNGKHYRSHILGSYGGGQDFAPGEIYTKSLDVGGRYGANGVGEYTCYIHSYPFFVSNAPYLNSDTIEFKVVEPKGEEKEALRLFSEAEKLRYARSVAGGPDFAKKELGFQKYLELVDRYPKSIYAPKALSSAVGVYIYSPKPEENRRVIPVCIKAIEDYPDSYYFVWAFTDLVLTYENLKDREGAIKTMKELIKKHPNTKISEEAQRRLKEIEKWEFK